MLRLVADKLGRPGTSACWSTTSRAAAASSRSTGVKRAAPDGYTLLQLDSEHLRALPHLYKSRNFVTLQTFDPVASLFRTPFFVTVPSDSKWKSMTDLLAAAKAKPGQLTLWLVGRGQPRPPRRAAARSADPGSQMQHVPFREVSQLFTNVGTRRRALELRQHSVEPGPTRPASCATSRSLPPSACRRCRTCPPWPNPAGPAGLEVNSFVVLVAPKGIPTAVSAKINADVAKAIADPDDPSALRHLRLRADGLVA